MIMHVNILADFTENGMDRNEPNIVNGTDNVYLAAQVVKDKLEKQGCKVQALFSVDGDWTLEQLHDMANYGMNLDKSHPRLLYASAETVQFMEELKKQSCSTENMETGISRQNVRQKAMRLYII